MGYITSGSNFTLDKKLSSNDVDIGVETEMKRGNVLFSNLDRLDSIKCDIEGYESIVIPELKPLILKFSPILLIDL